MKYNPILFSAPMVQAILGGRKTMTRRVVKPQPDENGVSYMKYAPLDWEQFYRKEWCPWKWDTVDGETISKPCPYGQPGDILWVRESFCHGPMYNQVLYKADHQSDLRKPGWKSPLFMPYATCRIFLRVTDVRVERLGDITEEDAIAEGVERVPVAPFIVRYKDYSGKTEYVDSAIESFRTLWQSIHGEWNPDTWVWVVAFERVEKRKNFI